MAKVSLHLHIGFAIVRPVKVSAGMSGGARNTDAKSLPRPKCQNDRKSFFVSYYYAANRQDIHFMMALQ